MKNDDVLRVELLRLGMKTMAESIPTKERCTACSGNCLIRSGCSMPPTTDLYHTCTRCGGEGRKHRKK